MITESDIEEVKKITEELLQKLHADYFIVTTKEVTSSPAEGVVSATDVVEVEIKLREPQMFIGQSGQTLMSLQRIAGIIAGRRLQKTLYLQLDINDYKKEKVAYLKTLAREAADEVVHTKTAKTLPPMSSYERRIIHTELAQRADISTQSRGEGEQRFIVIHPRQ